MKKIPPVHQTRLFNGPFFKRLLSYACLFFSLAAPALAQKATFSIPDQNTDHCVSYGLGYTQPAYCPIAGLTNDDGSKPNPNLVSSPGMSYYTSSHIGVRLATADANIFTLPSIKSKDEIAIACTGDPTIITGSFHNTVAQGEDVVIQTVIRRNLPISANYKLCLKLYILEAGTAGFDLATAPRLTLPIQLTYTEGEPGGLKVAPPQFAKLSTGTNCNSSLTFHGSAQSDDSIGIFLVPETSNTGDDSAKYVVVRYRTTIPELKNSGDHFCIVSEIEENGEANDYCGKASTDINGRVSCQPRMAWRNLSFFPTNQTPYFKVFNIGDFSGFKETKNVGFEWRAVPNTNLQFFENNFELTLDISKLPKSKWPDAGKLAGSNRYARFDSIKGLITLSRPELVLPPMPFKPGEHYPVTVGLTRKGGEPKEPQTFSSLFEEFIVDASGNKTLVGGEEVLVANIPQKETPPPPPPPSSEWWTKWWLWLIILILLVLILRMLRRKKS
ncbi:MAG TPA: hypothetical protein VHD83_12005 [Puia sp.]|nr:hypothetical protein [Puia sp.]